ESGGFHEVPTRKRGFLRGDRVGDGGTEDVAEERGFSRTARAGDHDEPTRRQTEIEALQIAELYVGHFQPRSFPVLRGQRPVFAAQRMLDPVLEEQPGERIRVPADFS